MLAKILLIGERNGNLVSVWFLDNLPKEYLKYNFRPDTEI